jgi:uncharacterized protein YcaQ
VTPVELSVADARRLGLRAQGLLGRPYPLSPGTAARAGAARSAAAVGAVLSRLGAVQLDTISTLARSHELVPYARLGPVGREAVETAYWGGGRGNANPGPARSFEYWSHAACVLPIEVWPWFAYRRRCYRRAGIRWHEVPTHALDAVRGRLRDDGPLTTTDLGGGRRGGQWWDWSETKIAVEWLLDVGEVVCTRRVGWRRVYDLADRVVPKQLREGSEGAATEWTDADGVAGPTDAECVRELLRRSAQVLGVGTAADLRDVHRLVGPRVDRALVDAQLDALVADAELVPVAVTGWPAGYAWAPALAADAPAGRCRTTMLSPFDSLVWDRARTSRLFGFDHTLEAYVPAAKRVHGYFTMPVLHGSRLVARVDPKRDGEVLHARTVTFETTRRGVVPASSLAGTARALREAAGWVGATQLQLGRVRPEQAGPALAALLR